jgi:REP element-mobilizing transposase RayT
MRDRLFVHLVWTTRGRQPLIDADAARYLVNNLAIIARQERARVLEIGIVTTHLHLVVRLHPSTCIPRLMQRMKGGTAFGVNRRDPKNSVVRWAKGYNIASISERALERVCVYVREQHHHHPGEAIPGWHVAEATARRESLKRYPNATVPSGTSAEPRL